MPSRTIIVHASNLLERGFLTTAPDRESPAGEPTNALYVATRALLRALSFKEPVVAVAVTDSNAESRAEDPRLRIQHQRFPDLLRAHGFGVVAASDPARVVAAHTKLALDAGDDVVVVGSDKRLAQLVGPKVWWYDGYKNVRYTPDRVRKRFEVSPDAVAGWLALVGDEDTLAGVKGIGKKGATGLVQEHGSVRAAIARADELRGRSGKALRAHIDDARRELARATLTEPLLDLGDEHARANFNYTAPDEAVLQARYGALGFFELLSTTVHEPTVAARVCARSSEARAAIAELAPAPVVLHVITTDPSPVRGHLVGVGLCQDETLLYFPAAGQGNHLQRVEFVEALGELLADAERPKIAHDSTALVVAMAKLGIDVQGLVFDTAYASHLREPSNRAPHDLPDVVRDVLRRPLLEEDEIRGVGRRRRDWDALPVDAVGGFAGERAHATSLVWKALETETDRAQLDEYLALSRTLARMELSGMAVDTDDLAQAGKDFAAINAEIETQIHTLAGRSFNINSTKQLGSVLFEDLELPIVKRTKTGWSTSTDALERIEHAHPIVTLVIRWRRLRRLTDSWVTALRAAIDDDGRVRSTFHPARSFSGRIINSQPDLGRVPGRTPEMERIRHAFRVPEGTVMLSVDYNQLGLYVLAHLTRDPALVEPLRREEDMHTLTAAAVLEIAIEEVGQDERQLGKVVNFATFAGQGASALALQLGVTPKVSKEYIERFDRHYAVARAFQEEQLELARTRGYIETLAGRRWPIAGLRSNDHMEKSYAERLARRATHEASVADVSRRGLLRADEAVRAAGLDARPLLTVLDEVLFEVPCEQVEETARVAAEAMRNAFALHVPLAVGCKVGPSWAELTKLEGAHAR